MTKEVLKFLNDYRESLLKETLDRFEKGTLICNDEREIRGRVLTLKEIDGLEFESMEQFYGSEVTEDEPS